MYLLKRSKQRSTAVEVHAVITDVIELFRPFLAEAKVEVQPLLTDETPIVRGSVALLEAILVNLMTNVINALMTKGTSTEQRQIRICTDVTDTQLELRFLDNGPGIQGLDLEGIWLPGRTNTRGGTGLGLTIVKGELGGAAFIINLPLVKLDSGKFSDLELLSSFLMGLEHHFFKKWRALKSN